jgi:solute carrier family 6 GABA transporter-like protein 1
MVMQVLRKVGNLLRKVGNFLAPPASKSEDGRDQWPSRAAFLLAAMGGCAGQGKS